MEDRSACIECKQIKPLSEFAKDKYKKTGYKSICLPCNRIRTNYKGDFDAPRKINVPRGQGRGKAVTNREWAATNPERRKEITARSVSKPENRAKRRADARLYKIQHPDAYQNWVKNNPEKAIANWQRRRNRFAAASLYSVSKKEIVTMYQGPCFYCGSKDKIQIDHVIPISRGGTHGIGNLVPACTKCNLSKGNKTIMEWRFRFNGLKRIC